VRRPARRRRAAGRIGLRARAAPPGGRRIGGRERLLGARPRVELPGDGLRPRVARHELVERRPEHAAQDERDRPAARQDDPRGAALDRPGDALPRLLGREALAQRPGHPRLEPVAGRVRVDHVLHERRVDEPEVRGGGARPVLGQLDAQRAPERLDRRLAHRVRGDAEAVGEGVDRRHDDHVPTALDDLRERRLDGAPHALRVHLEDALEGLRHHRARRGAAGGDARVGHHHVEPAEALDRGGHRLLHGTAVGDVAGEADRVRPDLGGRPLGVVPMEVDEHGTGAAPGHGVRRGEADATGRPRDEDDLAGEVVGHAQSPRAGRHGAQAVTPRTLATTSSAQSSAWRMQSSMSM
jgi:hypothetical protein